MCCVGEYRASLSSFTGAADVVQHWCVHVCEGGGGCFVSFRFFSFRFVSFRFGSLAAVVVFLR